MTMLYYFKSYLLFNIVKAHVFVLLYHILYTYWKVHSYNSPLGQPSDRLTDDRLRTYKEEQQFYTPLVYSNTHVGP